MNLKIEVFTALYKVFTHYLLDGNLQFTELYSMAPVVGASVKTRHKLDYQVVIVVFSKHNAFLKSNQVDKISART